MWGRTLQFLPKQNQREELLPWVIGVMLYLCALALTSGLALGRGLESWSAGLTTNLSVQIVDTDDAARKRQTDAALTLLRATPGVAEASVMAESRVLGLLAPWLGDIPFDSGLPLPTLVEVKLTAPDAVNIPALAERLQATAPGARLDDHQAWMHQILNLASVVQLLLIGIVVMVIMCTIAIVIFGCRAGLATHRESIEIMHLMGAEDKTIAQAFDERYLAHGLKGGLFGVLMAGLTIYGLIQLTAKMGQGLIQAGLPAADSLVWLAFLPVTAGIITMLTARLTVRRALLDLM